METIKYKEIRNDRGKLISYMALNITEGIERNLEDPIATIGLFGHIELYSKVTSEQFADLKKFAKLVKGD